MMHKRTFIVLTLPLASVLALSACSNKAPSGSALTASGPGASAEVPVSARAKSPSRTRASRSAPVSVASVTLGTAVGMNQQVSTATSTFSPMNTIYVWVKTNGGGAAKLEAKWTYQNGQTIKDNTKSIKPTGPATTTFSINAPNGLPTGNYQVQISLNGTPAASKAFSVD